MSDDLTPDDPKRAERLVEWVDRAFDACEKHGKDAVAPLIDELDGLDKNMVLHSLVVIRVADKKQVQEHLDRRDRDEAELRQRLDRANHLLSTAGMNPQ